MNPTQVSQAPSLARSLLAATAVILGLGLALGTLWHRSDSARAQTAYTPAATSHSAAWR